MSSSLDKSRPSWLQGPAKPELKGHLVPPIPLDAKLCMKLLPGPHSREQVYGWGVAVGVVLAALWAVMFKWVGLL